MDEHISIHIYLQLYIALTRILSYDSDDITHMAYLHNFGPFDTSQCHSRIAAAMCAVDCDRSRNVRASTFDVKWMFHNVSCECDRWHTRWPLLPYNHKCGLELDWELLQRRTVKEFILLRDESFYHKLKWCKFDATLYKFDKILAADIKDSSNKSS